MPENLLVSFPYGDIFPANVKAISYARVKRSRKTLDYSVELELSDFSGDKTKSAQNTEQMSRNPPQSAIAHEILNFHEPISFKEVQESRLSALTGHFPLASTQYDGADPFLAEGGVNQLE